MRLYVVLDTNFNVIYICTQFDGYFLPVITLSIDEAYSLANHLCEKAGLASERREQFEHEWDNRLMKEVT